MATTKRPMIPLRDQRGQYGLPIRVEALDLLLVDDTGNSADDQENVSEQDNHVCHCNFVNVSTSRWETETT